MSIIKFAKLQVPVAINLIRKEVASLDGIYWQPHLNRFHYEGQWDVLSLRSPGGRQTPLAETFGDEGYANTLLMGHCPSISCFIDQFQCEKLSVRLLNLKAGAIIKEHTDLELYFEKGEARLHVPVFTDPRVEFFLDNIPLCMKEGDCWYINANLPHRLANKSDSDRIHLVIDCKVNEWLKDFFEKHCLQKEEISDAEINRKNKTDLEQTIRHLRMMTDNKAALELALQLERQLATGNH